MPLGQNLNEPNWPLRWRRNYCQLWANSSWARASGSQTASHLMATAHRATKWSRLSIVFLALLSLDPARASFASAFLEAAVALSQAYHQCPKSCAGQQVVEIFCSVPGSNR